MSKRDLTLVMTFKNAAGTNTNVSLKGVKENLTEAEINGVINNIITKKNILQHWWVLGFKD